MKIALFVIGSLILFALLVYGARTIQARRRNRLREQWILASRKLGAKFEHDHFHLRSDDVRLHLKFENAKVAAPGCGGREHMPRTVLEMRVSNNFQTLKLSPEQINAAKFNEVGMSNISRQLISDLHDLSFTDDLSVEARGNLIRIDKIGWIDQSEDVIEFVSKGIALVVELAKETREETRDEKRGEKQGETLSQEQQSRLIIMR